MDSDSEEYSANLLQDWETAVSRVSQSLPEEDTHLMRGLTDPDTFLQNLETDCAQSGATWLDELKKDVKPLLRAFRDFSAVFVTILAAPRSCTAFAIAWGVFLLVVQLCQRNEVSANKMMTIHKKLKKALRKVNLLAAHLQNSSDLDESSKEAFVEIFVKLVKFWVESIKRIRKQPVQKPGTKHPKDPSWDSIANSMEGLLSDINESYREIKENLEDRTQTRQRGSIGASDVSVYTKKAFVLKMPENSEFCGRHQVLRHIHVHLSPATRKSNLPCYTLYGLAGVGKTQTAAHYVHKAYKHSSKPQDPQYSSRYDVVLWIDSENPESLRKSLSDIATALKLTGVTDTSQPRHIKREIQNWLALCECDWIVVFDNVDDWNDITDYWPPGGSRGAILITSRDISLARRPADAGTELEKLDKDESSLLLTSLLQDYDQNNQNDVDAKEELLRICDGLPLAVHQFAGIINAYHFSLFGFIASYRDGSAKVFASQGQTSDAFYKHTLQTAWRFPSLIDQRMQHMGLLGILCFMSPTSIPHSLFNHTFGGSQSDNPLTEVCNNEFTIRGHLRKLQSAAFISMNAREVKMHRLTQTAYLDHMSDDDRRDSFQLSAILVAEAFPRQRRGDPLLDHWADCSTYAPHVRSLALQWDSARAHGRPIPVPLQFLDSVSNGAWYLREINDLEGALTLIEVGLRAADSCKDLDATWKLRVAHLHNTRGIVLWLQYKYQDSRGELKKANAMREKLMRKDDIELIGTQANLASLIAAEGDYKAAQLLYEKAEAAHNRSSESRDDKRLPTCRYAAVQGRLHTELGDFEVAEQSLARSLAALNAGEDNLLYRRAIDYCYGNLRLAQGNHAEAEQYYTKCLENYPSNVEERDRLRTCGCHYKRAVIAMAQNQPETAGDYIKRAAKIASDEMCLGWNGRVQLLRIKLLEENPDYAVSSSADIDAEKSKIENVRSALVADQDDENSEVVKFDLYIPWQIR